MLEAVPAEHLRLGRTCIGASEDGEALLDGGEAVGRRPHRRRRRTPLGGAALALWRRVAALGGHRTWRAGTRFEDERTHDRFVEVWGVGGPRVLVLLRGGSRGRTRTEWPRHEFLRRYGAWFEPIPALIESTDSEAMSRRSPSVVRFDCCAAQLDSCDCAPRAMSADHASNLTGTGPSRAAPAGEDH